jgi:hypothetical protein
MLRNVHRFQAASGALWSCPCPLRAENARALEAGGKARAAVCDDGRSCRRRLRRMGSMYMQSRSIRCDLMMKAIDDDRWKWKESQHVQTHILSLFCRDRCLNLTRWFSIPAFQTDHIVASQLLNNQCLVYRKCCPNLQHR